MKKSNSIIINQKKENESFNIRVLKFVFSILSSAVLFATLLSCAGIKLHKHSLGGNFTNGAKLYFNLIYDKSEAYQNYIYTRFDIINNNKDLYLFLLIVFIFLLIIFAVSALFNLRLVPVIFLFSLCFFELYYGISADYWLNTLCCILLAVLSVLLSKNVTKAFAVNLTIVLALTAAISFVTFSVYPSSVKNGISQIDEINERVRDIFDSGEQAVMKITKIPAPVPENEIIKSASVGDGEKSQNESGNLNGSGGIKKRASNPKRVYLSVVNVIIYSVFALLCIVYGLYFAYKSFVRKKKLKHKNINFAFYQAMKLLSESGILINNRMLSEYSGDIENIFPMLSKKYDIAVNSYQKNKYSNESISDYEIYGIIDFYSSARRAVIKAAQPLRKFKIIFIKFL